MVVLVFFGFLYTPLISYVTARLEGIAGQVVEVERAASARWVRTRQETKDVRQKTKDKDWPAQRFEK